MLSPAGFCGVVNPFACLFSGIQKVLTKNAQRREETMQISTSETETVVRRAKGEGRGRLHGMPHPAVTTHLAFGCSYVVARNINLLENSGMCPHDFSVTCTHSLYINLIWKICLPEKRVLTDQTVYIKCSYLKSSDKCMDRIITERCLVMSIMF